MAIKNGKPLKKAKKRVAKTAAKKIVQKPRKKYTKRVPKPERTAASIALRIVFFVNLLNAKEKAKVLEFYAKSFPESGAHILLRQLFMHFKRARGEPEEQLKLFFDKFDVYAAKRKAREGETAKPPTFDQGRIGE